MRIQEAGLRGRGRALCVRPAETFFNLLKLFLKESSLATGDVTVEPEGVVIVVRLLEAVFGESDTAVRGGGRIFCLAALFLRGELGGDGRIPDTDGLVAFMLGRNLVLLRLLHTLAL